MSSYVQLYDLANKSGTDKGHHGPSNKWSGNNYTDVYQAYLAPIRDEVKLFCEIGLGVPGPNWTSNIAHGANENGGGSIRMWADFFPNAKLHGLDINPAGHLDDDRVTTHLVDQSSEASLERFKNAIGDDVFDVIIDDGSHIADHQQLTISLLWENLRPGGLYFIEDLNDLSLGERRHTKHAPITAESTLAHFQRFQATGEITGPHSFKNLTFLESVDYLAFHAFPVIQGVKDIGREFVRAAIGRGSRGLMRHEFNTALPRLLVLRKASQ